MDALYILFSVLFVIAVALGGVTIIIILSYWLADIAYMLMTTIGGE